MLNSNQLEKLNLKSKELFNSPFTEDNTYAGTMGSYLSIRESAYKVIFGMNIQQIGGMCGFRFCHNYNIDLTKKDKVIEFFNLLCKMFKEEILVGALITNCYTPVAKVGNALHNKPEILMTLGFDLMDFWNNPAHAKIPTPTYHYLSGVWVKKLDLFDSGLTKEQVKTLHY